MGKVEWGFRFCWRNPISRVKKPSTKAWLWLCYWIDVLRSLMCLKRKDPSVNFFSKLIHCKSPPKIQDQNYSNPHGSMRMHLLQHWWYWEQKRASWRWAYCCGCEYGTVETDSHILPQPPQSLVDSLDYNSIHTVDTKQQIDKVHALALLLSLGMIAPPPDNATTYTLVEDTLLFHHQPIRTDYINQRMLSTNCPLLTNKVIWQLKKSWNVLSVFHELLLSFWQRLSCIVVAAQDN